MTDFIPKRPQYYWIERVYTELVIKLLPFLKNTFITPNMVTAVNLVIMIPAICIAAWKGYYVAVAILIQVYLFFDILDGNLARYKNMCSDFGKKLDKASDILYYTVFYCLLGYKVGLSPMMIILFIGIFHLYGIVATFYIVPRLRKIKEYKRWGTKKILFDKGFILGMDNGMQNVFMTIFLLTPYKAFPFYISMVLYVIDMCYRLIELRRNQRLNRADGAEK